MVCKISFCSKFPKIPEICDEEEEGEKDNRKVLRFLSKLRKKYTCSN